MTEEQVIKYLEKQNYFFSDIMSTDVKLLTPKVQYKFLQLLKKYKKYYDNDFPDDLDNSQYQIYWDLRQSLITLMSSTTSIKLIPQLEKFYYNNYQNLDVHPVDRFEYPDNRLQQLRGL